MAAHVGESLETIGERGLEHNGAEIFPATCQLPDPLSGAGVPHIKERFFAVLDEKGGAWNGVIDTDHGYG